MNREKIICIPLIISSWFASRKPQRQLWLRKSDLFHYDLEVPKLSQGVFIIASDRGSSMKRVYLIACCALLILADASLGQTGARRVCGKCRQIVPENSKTGDTCPFCGVKWSDDSEDSGKSGKAKETISAPRSRSHSWDRIVESDSYTYGSLLWRWLVIGVGLTVSAIIVLVTIRFLRLHI